MEIYFGFPGIAFIIGFIISGCELLFGKYKLNHTLVINKPRYLLFYSLMFGLISGGLTYLIINKGLSINGILVHESPLLTAIGLGVTTKAISKISLFNLKIENKQFSIGPKLLTDYFEDFLLKKLNDDVDAQLIVEITKTEGHIKKGGRTFRQMDLLADKVLPTGINMIKRKSYQKEIAQCKSAYDKCRYIAEKFGIERLRLLKKTVKEENVVLVPQVA